jgi:hypothetical protein
MKDDYLTHLRGFAAADLCSVGGVGAWLGVRPRTCACPGACERAPSQPALDRSRTAPARQRRLWA